MDMDTAQSLYTTILVLTRAAERLAHPTKWLHRAPILLSADGAYTVIVIDTATDTAATLTREDDLQRLEILLAAS